jgi:dihydroorotate dehydrogenase electron transfer subunit
VGRIRRFYQNATMIETLATVESNRELAPSYRLLTLDFTEDLKVSPGQFAMLKAHASIEPLLRRALAIYRVHGPRRLSFLYQVLGRGTEALSRIEKDGAVEALIPLGNSWPIEESVNHRAIVVAGGIGSASVLMLCEALAASNIDLQLFFGTASKRAAAGCGLEDFRNLALPLTLTTDDGGLGERGFVTAPLERYLQANGGAGATIYTCGPWVMMRRVAALAAQFDVRCLVSLEAPMGCGFGVCVGCVVEVKTGGPLGYDSYKRVCTDGSIFPAEAIRWEVNAMTH